MEPLALDAAAGGGETEAGGLMFESVLVDVELFDHGTGAEIDAAPADQVVPLGSLGGLGG
ncbi:MAG: hypothetical protein ACFCVK_16505 [Acidimicrobiales bacterium]